MGKLFLKNSFNEGVNMIIKSEKNDFFQTTAHGSLLTRLVFRFGRTEKLTNFPFKKLFLEFSEQTYPAENYFLMKQLKHEQML